MKAEMSIGGGVGVFKGLVGVFLGLVLFSFVHTAFAEEGGVVPIQIGSVLVTGNTLIGTEEIQKAIALLLPSEVSGEGISSLVKFADAVTSLYHAKGYFLAQAYLPEQEIAAGVLNVTVMEGVLGEIAISGNAAYPASFIEKHFTKGEKGVSHHSFERSLLILNDYMDLKTTGIFQPGSVLGKTDLSVTVKDARPLHYVFEYNNFGSKLVSRHRFDAGVDVGNLLRYGSLLSARTMIGSPLSNATYGRVMYGIPVDFNGTRVNVRYGSGDFDIGKQLAVLDITMRTSGLGVSVGHPLIKTRLKTLTGEVGLDMQDFRQTFGTIPVGTSGRIKEDRLRVLYVGLDYDKQVERGRNMVRVMVRQGLGELLGGMRDGFPDASRAGADGGFLKGGLEVARFQRVTDKISLIMRGEGQAGSDTLVVGEQFSLGGPDSVRGYAVGEFLSDNGYRLNLEMRLSPLADKGLMQAVFFVDSGVGVLRRVSVGEVREGSLTGAGFGVRAHKDYLEGSKKGPIGVDFRADVGFPLEDGPVAVKSGAVFYLQALVRY